MAADRIPALAAEVEDPAAEAAFLSLLSCLSFFAISSAAAARDVLNRKHSLLRQERMKSRWEQTL